jgi:hypothetical protein
MKYLCLIYLNEEPMDVMSTHQLIVPGCSA